MNPTTFSQRTTSGLLLISALLMLAGCIDTNKKDSTATEITINAETGVKRSLTGTWLWSKCIGALAGFIPTDYTKEYVITGSTIVENQIDYTSIDGTCTGTTTTTEMNSAEITTGSDMVTSGWADVLGNPVINGAPAAQNPASGTLTDPATVTQLTATIYFLGTPVLSTPTFFYMDDTAAAWCLYTDVGPDNNKDGYLDYVQNTDPYCKI